MITGVDLNDTKEIVSASDKGDNPTKWIIGVLTEEQKMKVTTGAIDKTGQMDLSVLQQRSPEIVRNGLKGIKNYRMNKSSEPRDFSKDEITANVLQSIPEMVKSELAGHIIAFNYMTDEEEKN